MSPGPDQSRLSQREKAVAQSRHWVRLTSCCNNRCLFCLDADAQDGRERPRAEILEDLRRGRDRGHRRLVLSGGEPTIHPDLIELIRAGSAAGYERVQVISNGRMFARRQLLDAAVEAGLGELTLSLHGHTRALHDRLVGVPGAFAQTIRGLKNALSHPELVVNVDIVVCGPNVEVVDQIIALCRRLGVHEFDLLQVQPSGRAATQAGILYDPGDHLEALGRIFALGRRRDLFLWTNRFPADHLEGFEELIQDPKKLVDEVRGRFEHVAPLLSRGEPLRCRGALCHSCFLEPLCDELHDLARRRERGAFDRLEVDLRRGETIPAIPFEVGQLRLAAETLDDARRALSGQRRAWAELTLWLDRTEGLEDAGALELEGQRVKRLASEHPAVLEAGLGRGAAELELSPTRENTSWLAAHQALEQPRLVIRPAPRAQVSEVIERDPEPAELSALLAQASVGVEDLPPCRAGWHEVGWTSPPLVPELVGPIGRAGLERLVERYAAARFRARSRRCQSCRAAASCHGERIQSLRAFGLDSLRPRM